jgi:penicillin-binding protein-related factor A (putative recombinase)
MEFLSGKDAGTTFEKLFERQCQLAGLWAFSNDIRAKRGWKGKLVELKSNLDYTVMRRGGGVGFFDCKTFDHPHFTFSEIPEHQLELARRYNEFGIPAGFVVWLRPINAVSFFSGWLVASRGPGSRYVPLDGRMLGSWERFDPALLLP